MPKTRNQFVFFCLLITGYLLMSVSHALTVTAQVDKEIVVEDESFNLVISADDNLDASALDNSALFDDFRVGRTSVSRSTQIINGKTTRLTRWTTVLFPLRKGQLKIPSLRVDSESTQPIQIQVVSAQNAPQRRDLFIEVEPDTTEVYVQQQLLYKVKLFISVAVQRGGIQPPQMSDAEIRMIGQEQESSETRDGQRYRVFEYQFAITPQKSGDFTITGPVFEGEVLDSNQSSYGLFRNTRMVSRVGPSHNLTVKPIPSEFNGSWLPSEYVALTESWQLPESELQVGTPITRVITLTAVGVLEEQLPEIRAMYPPSIKSYPDAAETRSKEKDGNLIGQRTESVALIPSQAGQFVLPEVSVPWFNTITQEIEYATLPSRTINVAQAPVSATPVAPTANTEKQTPDSPPETEIAQSTEDSTDIALFSNRWFWISVGLVMLWLLTVALWSWRHKRAQRQQLEGQTALREPTLTRDPKLKMKLHTALRQNQADKATEFLTAWLCELTGQQATLAVNMQKVADPQLEQLINDMLASRYARTPKPWQGAPLADYLPLVSEKFRRLVANSGALEPLYPK